MRPNNKGDNQMEAKVNKKLLAVSVLMIVCIIVIWFSASIQGSEKIYEVRPEIALPEYRTDTARAIDAYERIMNRFIGLTEKNLTGISTDVKDIAEELISIDYKLTELSIRMARIENALNIKPSKKAVKKTSEAEPLNYTPKPKSESR